MGFSVGELVMPGDRIENIESENKNDKQIINLGPGLRSDGGKVYACKAGILKKRISIYYVDSYQKRYVNESINFSMPLTNQ